MQLKKLQELKATCRQFLAVSIVLGAFALLTMRKIPIIALLTMREISIIALLTMRETPVVFCYQNSNNPAVNSFLLHHKTAFPKK